MAIKKLIWLLLLSPVLAFGQAGTLVHAQYWCENGGVKVSTQGLSSTNTVQAAYPYCLVQVFIHNTTTPAALFSDNGVTPLTNPFHANAQTGYISFYVVGGEYDITLTGGGLSGPLTLADQFIGTGQTNVFPNGIVLTSPLGSTVTLKAANTVGANSYVLPFPAILSSGCLFTDGVSGDPLTIAACSGGGGSGVVSPGTTGVFNEYLTNGSTTSPSNNLAETSTSGTGKLTYAGSGGAQIFGPLSGTYLFESTAYTVAGLPASPAVSGMFWTYDAISFSDCTVGGGSGFAHYCYYSGSGYTAGGGGGGSVNPGTAGTFGEYTSSSSTINPAPNLTESTVGPSGTLTYAGTGGIQTPGGFQSTATTTGVLTLQVPSVGNWLLTAPNTLTPYGWLVPVTDVAGVLRSPGGGTTSSPSQLILAPINTGDLVSAVRTVSGTTDTVLSTDRAKFVKYTSASATAVTLPVASTSGFGANYYYATKAAGSGTVTITPTTSTIDGNATLVLTTGQECGIWSDGTNYFSGCGAGTGGGGGAFQVNGVNLISSSTINFQNSATIGGLVFGFTNPSGGNIKFGLITGTAQGNGTLLPMGTGTYTTNDLISVDPSGNFVDSGILKTAITSLSSLTAAGTSHTIANGNNPQTWGWAQTTNSQSAFTINDTLAATGTGDILLNINTSASSTEFPIQITASGTANGVRMSTTGGLSAIGTGAINANTCVSNLCLNATGLAISSILRVSSSSTGLMAASSITDNNTIAGTTEDWFAADLDDITNKLPVIKPIGVATAVDYLSVTNAATANPATVTVGPGGSDSNINLNLTSKGTGTVTCNGGDCSIAYDEQAFAMTGSVSWLSGTNYYLPGIEQALNIAGGVGVPIPFGSKIYGFAVGSSVAVGSGNTFAFTVRDATTTTDLSSTCSIVATGSSCTDTSDNPAWTAGHLMTIHATCTGTCGASQPTFTMTVFYK